MAIIDKKLELCDAQSLAGVASYSQASSNVINLGSGLNCWGDAEYNNIGDMFLNVRVATAFTVSGGTVMYLKTASTDTVAGSVSGTTVKSWTITDSGGSLKAGTTLVKEKCPMGYLSSAGAWTKISQYLALWFANSATAIVAGAIDAWIGMDTESEVPTS